MDDFSFYLTLIIISILVGTASIFLAKPKVKPMDSDRDQLDLFRAIMRGDLTDLKIILEAGVPTNKCDASGQTPLMCAVSEGSPEAVALLLKAGADPDGVDARGVCALSLAIRKDRPEMVHALLSGGCSPDLPDKQGQTPLMVAASLGDQETMDKLLEKGASPRQVAKNGWPVLFFAISSGKADAVRLLLMRGAALPEGAKTALAALKLAGNHFPQDAPIFQWLKDAPTSKVPRKVPWKWIAAAIILLLGLLGLALWRLAPSLRLDHDKPNPPDPNTFGKIQSTPFMRGCTSQDAECLSDEQPRHMVQVSPFFMAYHELTQAEYAAFLDSGHSLAANRNRPPLDAPQHPVSQINWYDALAYCNWRSLQANRTPVYSHNNSNLIPVVGPGDCGHDCDQRYPIQRDPNADGFRLPTEAEWEATARNGNPDQIYIWGNQPPAQLESTPCNWKEARRNGTAPVGFFPADSTPLGHTDLAGNVSEWVEDNYDPQFYQRKARQNPRQTAASPQKSVRGGHWKAPRSELRTSARKGLLPLETRPTVGLRLALNAD